MSNVVLFSGITKGEIDPDMVIEKAKGQLTEVVILGFDKDGQEYFAASNSDGSNTLWHLERAKHKLMNIVDEMCK